MYVGHTYIDNKAKGLWRWFGSIYTFTSCESVVIRTLKLLKLSL